MHKTQAIILCLLLLLSTAAFGRSDKKECIPTKDDLSESELAFGAGEKLDFEVHYKWGMINADVAKAYMKTEETTLNGKPVFHTIISGKVLKFYETFFKVRETLESWYDKDTFSPVRFVRISREGKYRLDNHSSFVWYEDRGIVTANMETSRKGQFSLQKELTNCTLDIPTMFSLLRNVDFSKLRKGGSYPLSFLLDDDVYTLHCVYKGVENKKVSGLGTVRCHKIGFEVVSGDVFTGDSDLYCWISDDDNRIPVYFSAPLKIGKVTGRLESYEGLKHPFESLQQ